MHVILFYKSKLSHNAAEAAHDTNKTLEETTTTELKPMNNVDLRNYIAVI